MENLEIKLSISCSCGPLSLSEEKNAECYQCGIPITGKPLKFEVDGKMEDFCCFGCYLINRTTGLRGEEGTALAFLGKFGFGYFLAMLVMMLSMYIYGSHFVDPNDREMLLFTGFIKWVILFLSTPVMILLGIPILKNSFSKENLLNFNTDTLIAIGSFSAYFLSVYSVLTGKNAIYFETATMILVLVTFGRYLETSSRVKASNFMKQLMDLSAKKATVIKDGKEVEIPVEEVRVGDIVKIKPGEKVSADGVIVEGVGNVDESILTGEIKPVLKKVGDYLYTGTTVLDGSFLIKVDKPQSQWTLNRFIEIMKQIRNTKAPINRITDRIAFYFLPIVFFLAISSFIYWFIQAGFEKALIVSLSVLLISCPCAFSIGAPLALWLGLGQAMKDGVIIKSAEVLEKLSTVKKVFFDKTGTITERTMEVSQVWFKDDKSRNVFYSLEKNSEHPLAKSFINWCKECRELKIDDFKVVFGFGIKGKVEGKEYILGSEEFLKQHGVMLDDNIKKLKENAIKNGEVITFLSDKQQILGFVSFSQKIRPEAKITIDVLKNLKVEVGILTGDSDYFANVLKKELQIEDVRANLLPEGKLKAIKEEKSKGKVVAMVGDGINDAPALAEADIGIAMGCGTDLTRESASISLIGDDLRKIPLIIILSRKVKRVIYTNIFWAFIYNIIGMGLAITGHLNPVFAALAMVLSSVFVIGNSLRIKTY
ncbi:copper-translocating P-type ATPase [Sulfurihydrogenibium azorense Az-Fu1]|uniref:Copper-translocating P-type ATPase n=1 Tax=Sulfurihydrogenibium azorense (strain DSM 15241 / OCM 825 / Az-Fu1) TaxID=204536 RepID=C1DXE4_SULAA|nr:cation-translocating P-type ATPase [Sulfurihydrogenibium azorense]ACN99573.1 copper-translocating P-type ATPase [Sulfurihydrogenibium azorense Az-Fu1]